MHNKTKFTCIYVRKHFDKRIAKIVAAATLDKASKNIWQKNFQKYQFCQYFVPHST